MTWNCTVNNSLTLSTSIYFQCRESLFYQYLSNKTDHFKNKKCTGGKHNKVCLSGMVADNVHGERLPCLWWANQILEDVLKM